MPLSDPSMQGNDDEKMSTLQDYDFDIDIEGELIRFLSSLPKEGTNKEREQNDHFQEPYIVDSLIRESIEDPYREQLHNHCLVDDNLSQCSSHTDFD